MYFDKLKQQLNGTTIRGANMEDINNASFNMLSESKHEIIYTQEQLEIIKAFELALIELYEHAENGSIEEKTITPMEVQDGKIVLKEGQVRHRCSSKMETLYGISIGGVLASEWFGRRESELEGLLCSFLSRRVKFDHPVLDFKNAQTASPTSCTLFFDENNPLMQSLLQIDYFEYEKIKKTNPEKLKELYSQDIIDLYNKIIGPNSPAGKKFHDSPSSPTYAWIAIPGGIPPQLINGICIHSSSKELISNIESIRKMYPSATIFDEKQTVLAYPLKNEKSENSISEKKTLQ